jgi:hypothetical protein
VLDDSLRLGRSLLCLSLGLAHPRDADAIFVSAMDDSSEPSFSDTDLILNSADVPSSLGLLIPSSSDEMVTGDARATRYKPVHRKVRPVPTYMPNPSAQVFQPIKLPSMDPLTHHPPPIEDFIPSLRLTHERLQGILERIPAGFVNTDELALIIHVIAKHPNVLAFTDAERGTFSPKFFPPYEIPTIEHTPWQVPPIRLPLAMQKKIKVALDAQLAAGKFEPSSASYCSAMFAVLRKTNKA